MRVLCGPLSGRRVPARAICAAPIPVRCRWRKDRVEPLETLPLPDDPVLASWASALNDAGHWAYVLDAAWRYAFVTDELRSSLGDTGAVTVVPMGSHYLSAEAY